MKILINWHCGDRYRYFVTMNDTEDEFILVSDVGATLSATRYYAIKSYDLISNIDDRMKRDGTEIDYIDENYVDVFERVIESEKTDSGELFGWQALERLLNEYKK